MTDIPLHLNPYIWPWAYRNAIESNDIDFLDALELAPAVLEEMVYRDAMARCSSRGGRAYRSGVECDDVEEDGNGE